MSLSTVAQCLQTARANLNDVAGTIFTDAALQPYFSQAYDELIVNIDLHQIPVLRDVPAIINVSPSPNGVHVLTIPTDFIRAVKLEEKLNGSSDDSFVVMDEKIDVDQVAADSMLRFWSWSENEIKLPRCTSIINVRLTYSKAIPAPTTGNISLQLVQLYLANRTAGLASQYIMQDEIRAGTLNGDANIWLGRIMTILVRNRQSLPARRIPYRYRYQTRKLPYIVQG